MAGMSEMSDAEYADRLVDLQDAKWKLVLDVQRPYRWNITRFCRGRVLEIGCGTGRNLRNLRGSGVGIDINAEAVRFSRAKGYQAFTPDEFLATDYAQPNSFDSLLCAHVLEHMSFDVGHQLLSSYLPYLRPGATVMLVCPQEKGYASDPTHERWVDFAELEKHRVALGLEKVDELSFPFPRWAGKPFIYNEFVLVGRVPKL